jgi:diaminohydroxyphosphoribosylaminopyrimidine deaminase / 5-amino-6-(5-phosphoribosylamino)uracil reductase
MTDTEYMQRALALAERGRGRTSPNPMVGAVIVDQDGVVIGRGAHEFAGGPHAEIHALRDAGDRARGATLYCTLEPCSHVGRTGPCAPAVVAAGLSRVVVATEDPNPLVAGRGLELLRQAGIEVVSGVLAEEAARLNRPFFTVMRRGRPFVTMKVALSADGMMAAAPGVRTPITGPAASRLIHRERAEVDAIAVGSGTLLADDPELTARGAFRARPLTRVVFDRRLRTPPSARLLSTRAAGPVIIVCTHSSAGAAPDRVRALEAAGAVIERVDEGAGLPAALGRLAALGLTSLVVEGGRALHRALWDAGLVDRVEIFMGGGTLGPNGMPWLPWPLLADGRLTDVTARLIGEDVMIEAYVHRPD